jgi:hypothetical protein
MHMYRTGQLGEPERIDPTMGEAGWGVGLWSANRPGEPNPYPTHDVPSLAG